MAAAGDTEGLLAGPLTADNPPCFSLLDANLHDSFLTQAFQQLDQRHRFGIVSRVCRSWRTLTLHPPNTINVTLSSPSAAHHFTSWLRNHCPTLHHLSMDNSVIYFGPLEQFQQLAAALAAATNLSSLKITYWPSSVDLAPLAALTKLTALKLSQIHPPHATMWPTLYHLRQLKALDLSHTGLARCDVPRLVGSLQQLTSLDLSHGGGSVSTTALQALRGLLRLQELRLIGCRMNAAKLQEVALLPCTAVSIVFHDDAEVLRCLLSEPWAEKLVELEVEYDVFWPGQQEAAVLLVPLTRLTGLESLSLCFPCSCDVLTGLTSLRALKVGVLGFEGVERSQFRQLSCLSGLQELTVGAFDLQVKTVDEGFVRDLEGWLPQLTNLAVSCRYE